MHRLLWSGLVFFVLVSITTGQDGPSFIENRGQWPAAVSHRAEAKGATIWLEPAAILVDRYDQKAIAALAAAHTGAVVDAPSPSIRHHAVRLRFNGANIAPRTEAIGVRRGAHHFLIGNDPTRWGRNCHAFAAVVQHDIYPGIDLRVRSTDDGVKYDIIVNPGADVSDLSFHYDGADEIRIAPDRILLTTSLGELSETIPLAFQEINGERIAVPCSYHGTAQAIGFRSGPYDKSLPLVIDPTLVFSTYSGSTANNFGYTATFDRDGFLYSGSSAFGQGYPVTIGAYQTIHAGGHGLGFGIDMALSKYDTTGTFMVWSTYLGGSSDELPHSIIVNSNDELFVYGTSSSPDFPTTPGAFDRSFNGGPALDLSNGLGANFPNGTDIVVARLSADGGDLLAATFVGGSGNDGLNTAPGLKFNYADEIRGEILLDENDNVFVASSTSSADMPVSPQAAQTTYGQGAQDGILMKLDASLSTMFWCTYFGGSGADALYNIELDKHGSLYIAGGTTSNDLPVSTDALFTTYQGGAADGFVVNIAADGSTVVACTYFGSAQYDQCYFADLDQNGDIYVFGQTRAPADMFIVNAPYNTPNSGQFVTKVDPGLTTIIASTRFGEGDGQPDISPTAFLVDHCNKVYISGWGGMTGNVGLSTSGLPVTPDAIQTTTNGSDFYLAVLDMDFTGLYYATYFGGDIAAEHVDGGTSRFDRRGRVYQSVCAGCPVCGGCPSTSDFPIHPQPGALSATNNSSCNNAVFKLDMDFPIVVADFHSSVNCIPAPVTFSNISYGASTYHWSFGDNTTSSEPSPSHAYSAPGVYTVRLVAINPATCNGSDTTYKQVVVLGLGELELPDTAICTGTSAQIGILPIASPGISYLWSPVDHLSNSTVPNPIASPTGNTTYTLTISNGACSTTADQHVRVLAPMIDTGPDLTICGPNPVAQLAANGFGTIDSFHWSSSNAFTDMVNATPSDSTASVPTTGDSWFYVRGSVSTCSVIDSVLIDVSLGGIALIPAEAICTGDTGTINVIGADPGSTIEWSPEEFITSGQGTHRIWTRAPVSTFYFVDVTSPSGCTWSGSVQQVVSPLTASSIQASATPTVIIAGGTTQLQASPSGLSYVWDPAQYLNDPTIAAPVATIHSTTLFTVHVSDGICEKAARVLVEVRELICAEPDIFVPNTFTPNGDGQNDQLYVRGPNISSLEFMLFDRWGEKIFETTDKDRGWDGTYEGKPVDPAVFVYHLTAYCVDGQRYFTKGNVTVVR